MRGNEAADVETLAALALDPTIRDLARGRARVRKLWEACQIPDFRKLSDDTHMKLCARVFGHIARGGVLPTDWLASQISALARAEGDIDTLMQRLSGVRVWTYIAARSDWVADAAHWQAQARAVEDLLSDALHEGLTTRFVDRRAAHLMRRLDAGAVEELMSAVTRRGEVVVEGHPVGHIEGFTFLPDPLTEGDERKLVLRAARRALRDEMPLRVARLEAAGDADFALVSGKSGTILLTWEAAPVGRLRPGATALRPLAEALDSPYLDGAQRERLRIRLQAFADTAIRVALAPLFAALGHPDPALRGVLHRLGEGTGVAALPEADAALPQPAQARLKSLGIRAGRYAAFMPALLKPEPSAMRALLWGLRHEVAPPVLPRPGAIAIAPGEDWPEGFAAAIGWVAAGPVLIRLDIAERIGGELAFAGRERPIPVPAGLASRLSVKSELLPAVLRGLGFRLFPAAPLASGQFGPPAPPMMAPLRRRPAEAPQAASPAENPFAALAALRRH